MPVPPRSTANAGDYLLRSLHDPECSGAYAYPVYVLVRLNRASHGDVDELRRACGETGDSMDIAGKVFAAAALVEFGYAAEGEARAQKIVASFDLAKDRPATEMANVVYGLTSAHLATSAMKKILNAVAQRSMGQAPWIGLEARAIVDGRCPDAAA